LATAAGVLTWMGLDGWLSKARKPTFLGGVNGMICGLVGITPCAGWVDGWGAILVGLIGTCIVWLAWNYLSKVRPFSRVDDALGVIYTHGIAGFFGGLMLGIFGDPAIVETGCGTLNKYGQVVHTSSALYLSSHGTCAPFSVSGLMYTGSWHQEWEQFRAAIFVILWSAVATFLIMKFIGLVLRGARYKDSILEVGDLAIHDEEAFPEETLAQRTGGFGVEGRGRDPLLATASLGAFGEGPPEDRGPPPPSATHTRPDTATS
jgi:ammonium transporter, Amt family